ncbi:FCD domain-containing protein [Kaistia adipata]|uniref:FCD domain-containing protein n=1 Tax=Kaistia adipata TaxID=166954 RepID=UPI000417941A|nr:FCD domain-containing protein [Kaistia adipata]
MPSDHPLDDTPARAGNQRAADAIVTAIEQDIVSGLLENGSPLPPERDLMGRFGISRTVVREAIATLTTRGLLESKPRHRPIVRRPGYDAAFSAVGGVVSHLLRQDGGVKTLYDVRIFLEASLVRHAALHARKEDIAALRTALEQNRAAIDDPVLFDNTDVAFHAIFYRILGNPVLPAVHRAFVTWLFEHWQSMNRSAEQNLIYYAGHKAIFDAIIDRDPDAAEQALLVHLGEAWETVRGTF